MATKRSGGRITGRLALTCEAAVALQIGDYVHLTGDYTVGLADGTKPVLGHVSVRNVKRESTPTSDTFPVGAPGKDVTVEARGFDVHVHVAAAAIAAGDSVGVSGTAGLVPVAVDSPAKVGIALTGATAPGQRVDVLMN
jgi:hypothetical protein